MKLGIIGSWYLESGKFLLKAKDPSLTLRITRLFGTEKGKEEAIAKQFLHIRIFFCDRLIFPPEFTRQRVILSGSEGSPAYF
jgi:hypothetical protein